MGETTALRPEDWKEEMTAGVIADVQRERERQKEIEGWTPEHDATHSKGEMAKAAACYALAASTEQAERAVLDQFQDMGATPYPISSIWPWSPEWWKPKSARRDLVRAAALLIAEIERLDIAALERDGPKLAQPWIR